MSTTTDLALKLIAPHPSNPRRDHGDLTELIASVKRLGVLQNLVVVPAPSGTKKPAEYVLVAGHRRLAAAKAAKLKTVKVEIREDLSPADQLAVMYAENGHRSDLTPMEEAAVVQGMLDLDLNQKAIAAKVHKSPSWVSERARLSKLPEAVTERVHAHQMNLTDALAVGEFDKYPDLQAEVIREIGGHNFAWALNRCRSALTRQVQFAKESEALTAAGVKILEDFPPEPDLDSDDADKVDQPENWRHLSDLESDEALTAAAENAGIDPADLQMEHVEAWHQATCPGHAAVGQRDYFETICLTPDVHPDYDGIATTPARQDRAGDRHSDAEFKAQQAERDRADREFAEGMAAAAASRRSHLLDTLALGRLETAEALLRDQILTNLPKDPAASEWAVKSMTTQGQALAGVLGVEYSTHELLVEQARKYVESATLPQLAILASIVGQLEHEKDLSQATHSWPHYVKSWVLTLAGPLGYVFSTFEQELLPAELKPALPVDEDAAVDESVSA